MIDAKKNAVVVVKMQCMHGFEGDAENHCTVCMCVSIFSILCVLIPQS